MGRRSDRPPWVALVAAAAAGADLFAGMRRRRRP